MMPSDEGDSDVDRRAKIARMVTDTMNCPARQRKIDQYADKARRLLDRLTRNRDRESDPEKLAELDVILAALIEIEVETAAEMEWERLANLPKHNAHSGTKNGRCPPP
jgi:hypothetical protein